jgi:hypothetical protein
MAVALHADDSGRCWPSAATLAELTGHHPSRVRTLMAELVAAEVLTMAARPGRSTVLLLGRAPLRRISTTPRADVRTPRVGARGRTVVPRALTCPTPRADVRDPARQRAGKIEKKKEGATVRPFATVAELREFMAAARAAGRR